MALRPALMDEKGIAFFTGTPRGHNWYFQLWTRGQDPTQTDYKSWSFPSSSNPYLDPAEIAAFARDMPELAYRQEVMAEFLDDVGSVFRGVDRIVKGTFQPPEPHKEYVMGADLAKLKDYTVLAVLNMDGHLCAYDRFTQIDWVFQRKRIVQLAQQYNARLLIDSTGVGDPVCDEPHRENVRVDGYKFTNATKKDLIENLSMMIENQKLTIPQIPELINELKLYGYKTTPSGNIQYGAPESYHDDCVTALALAAWQLKRTPPPGVGVKFSEDPKLLRKKGNIYNHPFFR
jgi:phage FluMu gp28-like protein